ncbi:MAG: DsbA family oxidoreductase [Lachnotalea sp.]
MKIEIWSDYACPFCYIGKRKLELAIQQASIKEPIEIEFKSFELNPDSPKEYKENIHEIIASKYGIPVEEARATNDRIISMAKEVGLNYNFDDLKPTNTFDAHRLSHYAKAEGKNKEYSEAVLKSYFVESNLISNHEVLADLAESIGLDKQKALAILSSDQYAKEVREDEKKAHELRVDSVPYFLFNGTKAISGALPVESFLEVFQKIS